MRNSQIRLSKGKKTDVKEETKRPKNQYMQRIESLRKEISENNKISSSKKNIFESTQNQQ